MGADQQGKKVRETVSRGAFLQIEQKTIESTNTLAHVFPSDIFTSFCMEIHTKYLNHSHCTRWCIFNKVDEFVSHLFL